VSQLDSPAEGERTQTRLLAGVTGSLMLGLGMLAPLTPLLRSRLHLSGHEVGLILGAFPVGRLLFSYVAGLTVDRFGFRSVGVAACVASSAFAMLVPLHLSAPVIIVAQAGMGAGSVFFTGAAAAHVLETASPGRAGRAMSAYQTLTLIGASLGPGIGGLAGSRFGLQAPFFLYAALTATAAVVTALVVGPGMASGGAGRSAGDSATPLPRESRRVYSLLALSAFVLFCARTGQVNTLIPALAYDRLQMSVRSIGIGLSLTVLATVVVVPHAGRTSDRGGSRQMMLLGGIALAISVALLGQVQSAWQLMAVLVLFGVATGYVLVAPQVLLVDWSPPGRRGRAVGMHRSASSLGMVVGPLSTGWAVETPDQAAPFTAGALVLLAVAVAMRRLPGAVPPTPAVPP
jgi:DHA1 family multidrug resistance protein-like MFS transporter